MSQLKVYKASAGSGKTHTLAEEYLKLASEYPENFKRILAVTFTNKAAGEMKQRILESLNQLVIEGRDAPFYQVFADSNNHTNEIGIVEKAKSVRDHILHDYSSFSLSTIDSFIQRVIKSFTFEIGIDSGYRIELDTEKVIIDLTEILYQQIDADPILKDWLIQFANYKMDDGKNWDFRAEIKQLAKEIFKEQFQSLDKEVKDNDLRDFQAIFEKLWDKRRKFEHALADLGNKALNLFESTGFQSDVHGRNLKVLSNYLSKTIIEQQKFDALWPPSTILKMMNNPDPWSNKNAGAEIVNSARLLYSLINPVLQKVEELLRNEYPAYLSVCNILYGFHAYGIIRKISSLLPDYRSENNLLLISDTTRLLKEIIAGNEAPFIYEKIGNRYRHVLIDEFQDTSGFQWEIFKPLIRNGLSEGNANLIVGDIKQSIYRWRGGDWDILMSRLDNEIGRKYIVNHSLDTNWRSKKNIIDFNNDVFLQLSALLQQIFDAEYAERIDILSDENLQNHYQDIITKAYADVFQDIPLTEDNKGGRVKVKFIHLEHDEAKTGWHYKVEKELPVLIDDLLKKKNYEPGDIAILVRKNDEGKEIADFLLNYQQLNPGTIKYQIISSESLLLASSPVVQILVDAIHFLNNTEDNIYLFALISKYVRLNNHEVELSHQHFDKLADGNTLQFLPSDFVKEIYHLKKLHIYELTEELTRIFYLNKIEGQFAYLQSFQDIVLEFTQNESSDLDSFIAWWDEKGQNFSLQLSDQPDAIKIVSVHRSKGLAFKIVIVPFCDWDIKPQSSMNNIIWTSSDFPPFNQLNRFPVVYRTYLKNSLFWREYFNELLYSMIDSLNILYVAFTRPKEELIILSPLKEKMETKFNTVGDLLFHVISDAKKSGNLTAIAKYYSSESGIFESAENYCCVDAKQDKKHTPEKSTFEIHPSERTDWNSKISIIRNADDFFVQSIEYIKVHVDYGKVMHEIFSKIDHTQNIESVVDDFYYNGKIDSSDRTQILKDIREMLTRKEVSDWFSNKWEVKVEDAILSTSGQIRIPDRVLLSPDETLVIDFKFGEQSADSVPQVREYMDLLRNMNYPRVKGFIYYAKKNIIEEVV